MNSIQHAYIGIVLSFALSALLAIPLGRYIARVYLGEPTWLDIWAPVELRIFRFAGIDPEASMDWKQFLKAMLGINLLWFVYGYILLTQQGHLPLNPAHNPGQAPDLAFNSSISFVTNTNLQHYSGEADATYFSQLGVFAFLQFCSAASGMAALVALFNAFREKTASHLGNFYTYFLKSITRILLPLSLILASILVFSGVPSGFKGPAHLQNLQGDSVTVARGPAAALVAIKQLGTNGGGYFGANSAHPFENPNEWSNLAESLAITLIPMALIFAFGYYIRQRRLSHVIFGIMTLLFLAFAAFNVYFESRGNPALARLGISQQEGNMEGKEQRIGAAGTAYWSVATTSTSNGSVNGTMDSMMPLSGCVLLLDMMINALYGGVGVGLLNFFIYMIIAVFISGLMVGRTPEFLGHKVEAREVKIAVLVTLLATLLIKAGTALAAYIVVWHSRMSGRILPAAWLHNPGFHGFTEMLYQFTSATANNGSAFEGLADNTAFWNISTGVAMLLARFLPIIGPVAIAGMLARKKYIPESGGTLRVDSWTFGVMILVVILIVNALSYFPSLALGPIADHFSLFR